MNIKFLTSDKKKYDNYNLCVDKNDDYHFISRLIKKREFLQPGKIMLRNKKIKLLLV